MLLWYQNKTKQDSDACFLICYPTQAFRINSKGYWKGPLISCVYGLQGNLPLGNTYIYNVARANHFDHSMDRWRQHRDFMPIKSNGWKFRSHRTFMKFYTSSEDNHFHSADVPKKIFVSVSIVKVEEEELCVCVFCCRRQSISIGRTTHRRSGRLRDWRRHH